MTLPWAVRVIGFGDAFRDWGIATLQALAATSGTAAEIVEVSPGDMPDDGALVVVFMDDVTQVLRQMIAAGHETMSATRAVTAMLAALEPSLGVPGRVLVRRTAEFDVAAACGLLMERLPAAARHTALPDIAALPLPPQWEPLLGGQALALARQILAPMARVVSGETASIVFPLACFYSGNHPDEIAAPLMTLAGPRRPLYYGPYFHLPRGQWRVAVQLLLLEGLTGAELSVDVFAERELARVRLDPREPGLFQIWLSFANDDPHRAVEFRVWVERGAIEGTIGLRHITLQRIAPTGGSGGR